MNMHLLGATNIMTRITKSALGLLLVLSLSMTARLQAGDPPPEVPAVLRNAFAGHTDRIDCVAVTDDGKTICSGGADKTVRLWNAATGEERFKLDHTDAVDAVAFSPDGSKLATGAGDSIFVWNADTGKQLLIMKGAGAVARLAFSADGKLLGASGHGWKAVYDADSGEQKTTVTGGSLFFALAPDGQTLAYSQSNGDVQLWNVTKGVAGITLKGHIGAVSALAFSPDSKTLATGAYGGGMKGGGQDKSIKLWDVASGKEKATLIGHKKGIYALTFSADGKALLAADYNGSMKLWDTEGAAVIAVLEKIKVNDVLQGTPVGQWAFSPNLKTWVVGTGKTVLWLDISEFTSASRPAR
jgi:WD40 repeat protein